MDFLHGIFVPCSETGRSLFLVDEHTKVGYLNCCLQYIQFYNPENLNTLNLNCSHDQYTATALFVKKKKPLQDESLLIHSPF